MTKTRTATRAGVILAAGMAVAGCDGRSNVWTMDPGSLATFGLGQSIAIVEPPARRVVALTVDDQQNLQETRLPTGTGVLAVAPQPNGQHLYVLSGGFTPGLGDERAFEAPRLTVITDGSPPTAEAIDLGDKLTDPLSGLAVDPEGRWAVLYASADAGNAFVTNPNELVIVDLASKQIQPVTLHSFGGKPERLIFTPELGLPGGAGHLLIVQSQQDLALLRLEKPATPEITVRLADTTTVHVPKPAAVVIDDGDPTRDDDARLGLRFDGDSTLMTLQLEPSGGEIGFTPSVNVADAGGVPTDIAFVRTDGGLRLAALVPSRSVAVLVDPVTTITTEVSLPAPYQRLSLVTGTASGGGAAAVDVALLWQGRAAGTGVAFWELGQAAGTPFRSIEVVGITAAVSDVLDVPLDGAALKVLETSGDNTFYVLDLETRTAAPLVTTSSGIALVVSPTGERVWTWSGTNLASTELASKHARSLRADSPITDAFEIGRPGGGRSLVALHQMGGWGATVFDVAAQNDGDRLIYGGLLV